jgi:hypothetical protein
MRRLFSLLVLALVVAFVSIPAAQARKTADEDRLVGTWSGTFDGDASGAYSMAFERDATTKLTGTLRTSPNDGDGYSVTFKTILVAGPKVNLAYDAPVGEKAEVHVEATLEGASLKGTWKVVDAASKSVTQAGTLVGKKG